jgi:ABC-type uncharacterized transport system auxiliary subunit
MSRLRFSRVPAALLVLVLGGCAAGEGSNNPGHAYDLGIEAPAAQMPTLELRAVRALQPFDGVAMYYRLAYQDGAEVAAFAHARWAAPPAELVRRQLARATRAGTPRCALEVEVQEFSQVFGAKDSSAALLELLARLEVPNGHSETRALRVSEPDAGANAAQGANAMRRAVARAVSELARWIDGVTACRG